MHRDRQTQSFIYVRIVMEIMIRERAKVVVIIQMEPVRIKANNPEF